MTTVGFAIELIGNDLGETVRRPLDVDEAVSDVAHFGAMPVAVFGVEVIAVLFGSVVIPLKPIAAMPRAASTATAPITQVVGLMVRSDVPGPGVGGTGRLFGFELS
jgi:hypothetical protein